MSAEGSVRASAPDLETLREVLSAEQQALLRRLGPGLERLAELRDAYLAGRMSAEANRIVGDVQPPGPDDLGRLPVDPDERAALAACGVEALRDGRVGLVLLNGGMATRFGGVVKGTVPVVGDRSFLALKLQDALRVARRLGAAPPAILVMESVATREATLEHLARHDHFGYPPDRLWHFDQQWTMRLRPDGAPWLDGDGRPSFYGPGHGDLGPCLRRSGLLDRFRAEGGALLLMSNVDNVLATLDPVLVGRHLRSGVGITVELAEKLPGDAGGLPARVDGKLQVVESFRFPTAFDQDAVPVLNANTFWLSVEALGRDVPLTWFVVKKDVDGRPAIQFERLVGELTAHVPTAFVQLPRHGPECRFYPVKQPEDLARGRDELVAWWEAKHPAS